MKVAEFLGGTVLFAVSGMFRGFVLSILWGWFAVATLGAAPLGVAGAIGFSLMVGMFTVGLQKAKSEGGTFSESLSTSIGTSTAFLLFGYLVHLFV